MPLVSYVLLSLLGASNMILWGVYADLLMEKFSIKKVLRSLAVGVFAGIYLYLANETLPPIIVVFSAIAIERFTTEVYKNVIREETQEKYLIPSTMSLPFPSLTRRVLGLFVLAVAFLAFKYIRFDFHFLVIYLMAIVPAITGALKDAPHEGFSILKFFRLPLVVLVMGILINKAFPTLEDKYLLLAMGGGERVISECYKKIIRAKVPGKFKVDNIRKPNKEWESKRKYILVPYFFSLIAITAAAIYSL